MGYEANKPAFAGSSQSAQADLVSPIAHDFNRGTGVWIRYPCGVACGAGDLVEQQKPLDGGSWTTSALYLQGISLVRRNSEWHHFDPLGTAGVSGFNKAPAGCISARQEPRPPRNGIGGSRSVTTIKGLRMRQSASLQTNSRPTGGSRSVATKTERLGRSLALHKVP